MIRLRVVLAVSALAVLALPAAAAAAPSRAPAVTVGPISVISGSCNGQSAEVQEAVDPATGNQYAAWMGCQGITFARRLASTGTWSAPVVVPGGGGSSSSVWDPAITVSGNGTVYVAFIRNNNSNYYPVVDASFDLGATFAQTSQLIPPQQKNWGDRPFIAVAPDNKTVYVTWDYGPNRSSITYICPKSGSCAFATGDLNVVVQVSRDGGKTFGAITPINPGFPAGGGDAAPVVVEPNGRVDVVYQDFPVTNTSTYTLAPATNWFTSSSDGGATWSPPVRVGAAVGTMALAEWWIEPSLGIDAAGNLYVAWDTQSGTADTGWIDYSTDHGATWAAPVQASTESLNVPHITQVVGGASGIAYVAWLSNNNVNGYALYLRPFKIGSGFAAAPVQVSTTFGNSSVWPGDTFGMAVADSTHLALSWGGANGSSGTKSLIWATTAVVG